ncbi:MAG TPA: branched-chain amino acid ABC transporter permease [Spirochaetota bacterium]|nr:branched-chain amino acid ABC transporter permease [Spirochaetota bacterium]
MPFEQILQYIFSGITNGSIYAIVAIGFNIIYNTTGIINFAQGEFLMLGGMTAISLSAFMPLPVAILASVVITSFVGALIDFIFIRRLKKPTVLNMVIITIGLSILIRDIALHVWDEKVRSLPYFTGSEVTSINILGAYISPQVLWVLGVSGIIVALLGAFFRVTVTGRSMRACASNMTAARLCGINTRNMVTISFMLSAAIGALAGCVVSPITQTQYDCGTSLAIKGFTVAILGGLGNSTGAVIGGIVIGLLEAFSISIMPLAYKDAIAIAVLLLILFVRPSGLFGKKEAAGLKEF